MPSKAFLAYQQRGPELDGAMENMPRPQPGAGVPTMPEGWEPPEPVIPEGFTGGKVTVGGVLGAHLTRPGLREKCAMMHIHGGGFTIGSAMMCTDLLEHFAKACDLEGYSVEYRLAPKHKFPAAVDDCVAFYKGLLDMGYERIVVGGESAGAGLTLSLTVALKQQGLPLPAALWCSSPIDDIRYGKRETYMGDMFTDMCERIRQAYAPDADPEDPVLSPAYADFTGFPPMIVQTGGAESLSACAVRIAAKAAAADVELRFHYAKDMPHTFAMDFGCYPEADNAMAEITRFINDTLDVE